MPSLIAVTPLHRASSVMRLGRRTRTGMLLKRGRRSGSSSPDADSRSGIAMACSLLRPPAGSCAFHGGQIGQNGLSCDRTLADCDEGHVTLREVNVNTAAETNKADPLARRDLAALVHKSDDPAGDQPGDLDDADAASGVRLDGEGLAFIVFAGLVQVGIDEFAGHISDADDPAVYRRAIHMHVEDIHENGDTLAGTIAQSELRRRGDFSEGADAAIGGGDDKPVANRRGAL